MQQALGYWENEYCSKGVTEHGVLQYYFQSTKVLLGALAQPPLAFFKACRVGSYPNCIAKKVGVEEFTVEKLRGNMEALNREGGVVNALLAQELSDYFATEVVRHRNPAA